MARAAGTTRTGRGKGKAPELVAQADPQASLDGAVFLKAARPVLAKLAADLLERAQGSPGVQAALVARHAAEVEDQRTGDPFAVWQRRFVGQVTDAWLLSCVFVRTLEDRGLLGRNRLAGPGAVDSQKLFLELAPSLTERDYLLLVFRELARFPAARSLFNPRHNPVWKLAPSAEGAKALLQLFRTPDAGAPGFRFGQADTRFLGDLYQDLDEEVREQYALLQTPRFVESFILDRTLEPAIERFGLDDTNIIDPTCGSGHFLLGAFERLCDHQLRNNPGLPVPKAADRALAAVAGTDINPYAVAIAKFRLTLAYLEKAGLRRLKDAPELKLNVAAADSLLQVSTQTEFADRPGQKADVWRGEELALEDEEEAKSVLGRRYAAVVGNPPYISMKDPVLKDRYRAIFESAFREFSLAAVFTERFFQLARERGRVGLITANSFMKRIFGRPLVEKVLPGFNVDLIINTAGAYIPGHGTPTVLLFGSAEAPQREDIPTVLGKRGEPTTPDDPEFGVVWQDIVKHWNDPDFQSDYISVTSLLRSSLSKHPWSLGGGGVLELKDLLEERRSGELNQLCESLGFMCITKGDDVFSQPAGVLQRAGIDTEWLRRFVVGEHVRDWTIATDLTVLFPYDAAVELRQLPPQGAVHRYLWPYRSILESRAVFGGKTFRQAGRPWYAYGQIPSDRVAGRCIAFAFVATHNHFVLDRGGKMFKQTAPIIKLPVTATEEDYLALLAYLNSSTACFWMKQVMMNKGATSDTGVLQADEDKFRFEFDGTKLKQLPLPPDRHRARLGALAAELCRLVQEVDYGASLREMTSGHDVLHVWSRLDEQAQRRLQHAVALQEEIDWVVYDSFALTGAGPELLQSSVPPDQITGYPADARPFLLPSESPVGLRSARRSALQASDQLALVERAEYKRRWYRSVGKFNAQAVSSGLLRRRAAEEFMLDTLENVVSRSSQAVSWRMLKQDAAATLEPRAEVFTQTDTSARDIWQQARASADSSALPFLSMWALSDDGISKRTVWEETWRLQRCEDGGEKLGPIFVPPKYDVKDFRDPNYFRLRGKLDVPGERFISYPGCESDQDGESVYGWAGWNHLQRAQALTALYQKRKAEEAWRKERLTPMLAGLLELIPWVKQWHNEPSEEFGGLRLGEYFETFLAGECAELGLTTDDLRAWRPPTKGKGLRKRGAVADDGDDLGSGDGLSSRPSSRAAGKGRKRETAVVQEDASAGGDTDGPFIALPEGKS